MFTFTMTSSIALSITLVSIAANTACLIETKRRGKKNFSTFPVIFGGLMALMVIIMVIINQIVKMAVL